MVEHSAGGPIGGLDRADEAPRLERQLPRHGGPHLRHLASSMDTADLKHKNEANDAAGSRQQPPIHPTYLYGYIVVCGECAKVWVVGTRKEVLNRERAKDSIVHKP